MKTLVTDFDGTVTRRDFFELVREKWAMNPDPWEDYVAGRLTHFEALQRIFAAIRCPESELLELVDRMEVDPAFFGAVETLTQRGWRVVVASAGCAWYIERLLAPVRDRVTVFANPGDFSPGSGLQMSRPEGLECVCEETGIDKVGVVRRESAAAFAGDGRPDLAPSLLVPPSQRFARGWLAEALAAADEEFVALSSWETVVLTLAK